MTLASFLLALTAGGAWLPIRPGLWHWELRMAERGPLAAVRVVAVRIDPTLVRFSLDSATRDYGTRGAWTIDRLPRDGLLAFNTGQFIGGVTWGWLVHEGTELGSPGKGPLSMALVVDSAGAVALLSPDQVPAARGHVRLAIQSYPALLTGTGAIPEPLLAPGHGIDVEHRDSRLAIGILADGSVVVALTRFGLGPKMDALPWGPTVGEMAEFMRSLGCLRAMMLDGGISSQMALRSANGSVHRWTNWRKVPVGIVVTPRDVLGRSTAARPLKSGTR
jgi:phosphodiester glycosidase